MLQIHDELAMSVSPEKRPEKVALIMQNAVPLELPSLCDVELGPSWGEAV